MSAYFLFRDRFGCQMVYPLRVPRGYPSAVCLALFFRDREREGCTEIKRLSSKKGRALLKRITGT